MATATQVSQFIARIAPIAQEQAKKHGNKIFPSICIAQACCESAYGTATKMIKANALFGVKVGKSAWKYGDAWKGAAYKTGTTEYYDGKNAVRITDYFRAYPSLEASVEDYMDLLCTSKRYANALNRKTPRECIQGIKDGGYATSPTYVQTIMSIVDKYNLTKYDPGTGGRPKAEMPKGYNPFPVPNVTLRNGSIGQGVQWLQLELDNRGYHLNIDGVFGPKTEAAVKEYQKKQGLVVDGIVGARTRGELTAGR